MKTFLLSFCFLFVSGIAQNTFNRAYHAKSEYAEPSLVEMCGGYYFVANHNDAEFSNGGCYLYKYDKVGNLVYRTSVSGPTEVKAAFKTLDNNLFFAGNYYFCGGFISAQTAKSAISKVDTNGNVVFTTTLSLSPGSSIIKISAALQYIDSSYVVFTDSSMLRFNKTGTFIIKYNLGVSAISSAILMQNNNILVSAAIGSSNYVCEFNTWGALISQYQVPVLFNKMRFKSGMEILGLSSTKKMYKLSSGFQVNNSSALPASELVEDFDNQNDSIYLITTNNGIPGYYIMNASFGTIQQSNTTTQRVQQAAIIQKGPFTAILSTCQSDNQFRANNTISSLNVINKLSSNNFGHDIGVVSLNATAMLLSASTHTTPSPSTFVGTFGATLTNAYATVKNYGNAIITDFKLNCFLRYHVECGQYFYQTSHTNLSLNPGDTISVPLGAFSGSYYDANITSYTFTFCVYTTMPNKGNDKLISNDGFCYSVPVTLGLSESQLEKGNIEIFPNPANKVLTIRSTFDIKNFILSDVLGRTLESKIVMDKEDHLSIDQVPPGIYFISVETEKGTIIRKIIKE